MATMPDRVAEDHPGQEDAGFEMILDISSETRGLLSRLAAEAGGNEFEVIGKAVALYQVALDALKEGKHIGIFDEDCELEREIVGL
jgi:hypothetical protein